MKIQVRLNNYRRSARKVREIIPVLKGLSVVEALNQLEVMQKGSAYDVKKLLISAIATAENDFNLNKKNLIIGELMVQEGKTLKRWRARAYGRANQILKRTCHILLTVEEKTINAEKIDKKKAEKHKKPVKKAVKKITKKVAKKKTKKVVKK
jgi:large subunit ribosomal protein L22